MSGAGVRGGTKSASIACGSDRIQDILPFYSRDEMTTEAVKAILPITKRFRMAGRRHPPDEKLRAATQGAVAKPHVVEEEKTLKADAYASFTPASLIATGVHRSGFWS